MRVRVARGVEMPKNEIKIKCRMDGGGGRLECVSVEALGSLSFVRLSRLHHGTHVAAYTRRSVRRLSDVQMTPKEEEGVVEERQRSARIGSGSCQKEKEKKGFCVRACRVHACQVASRACRGKGWGRMIGACAHLVPLSCPRSRPPPPPPRSPPPPLPLNSPLSPPPPRLPTLRLVASRSRPFLPWSPPPPPPPPPPRRPDLPIPRARTRVQPAVGISTTRAAVSDCHTERGARPAVESDPLRSWCNV